MSLIPCGQMYRASMFYGRRGLPILAISVVDLAIWDLLGKIRKEPVFKMIGGRTKPEIPLYLTGPLPAEAKRMGFFGGKVRVFAWIQREMQRELMLVLVGSPGSPSSRPSRGRRGYAKERRVP